MADAFVIGDGVSLFASVGIMMPIAPMQEDLKEPVKNSEEPKKKSDLHDQLMQDLGLSDAADSDEEEWPPTSTQAPIREPLKNSELHDRLMDDLGLSDSEEEESSPGMDGFREALKPSELHDQLMKDLGSDSEEEEEWAPTTSTKPVAVENDEEKWHPKSQFDTKEYAPQAESEEEEWAPKARIVSKPRHTKLAAWDSEGEEEWHPTTRFDTKDDDEEEWVPGAPSDTSESDEEEWAPELPVDSVVRRVSSRRRQRCTDDRRRTRRSARNWQSLPVDNTAKTQEPPPVDSTKRYDEEKRCLYSGCGSRAELNGRCEAHSVKCSTFGCSKFVLRDGKCFSHCGFNVCSNPECFNIVRGAATCLKHSDKKTDGVGEGSEESEVSYFTPVKLLEALNAAISPTDSLKLTGRAIAEASSDDDDDDEEDVEDEADDDGDDDYDDEDEQEDEEEDDEPMSTEGRKVPANGRKETRHSIKAEYNACRHQGCFAVARLNGKCIRHGGGRKCSQRGCSKYAFSNGTCLKHVKPSVRSRQESITRFLTKGAQPQTQKQASVEFALIIQTGPPSEPPVPTAPHECKPPQVAAPEPIPAMMDTVAAAPQRTMELKVEANTEVLHPAVPDQGNAVEVLMPTPVVQVETTLDAPMPVVTDRVETAAKVETVSSVANPATADQVGTTSAASIVDRLEAASRLLEKALAPAHTTTVLTSTSANPQYSNETTVYFSRPVCVSFAVPGQSRVEAHAAPTSGRNGGGGRARNPHKAGGRCTTRGCQKKALTGGVCFLHGGGSICAHPTCVRLAHKNGLCSSHQQFTQASMHPYAQLTQEWRT